MLFVLFELGQDRYAIQATQVLEVLPLLNLKKIPRAPLGVAGAFSYRGTPVPVIDLGALIVGIPTPQYLSTRLLLVNYPLGSGQPRTLGLIAERVTATIRRAPGDFDSVGVTADSAPYLGPVAKDQSRLIQRIDPKKLLSASIRDSLFREDGEAA